MSTTLYHATVMGGPTGIAFQVGRSLLFTAVEDETVYVVNPAQLVLSAPVAPSMAAFLTQTVVEPRLAQMGGAR